MNEKDRKTAVLLFVRITELLEDAHEVAIAGQSPHLQPKPCVRYARKLQIMAGEIKDITEKIISLSSN